MNIRHVLQSLWRGLVGLFGLNTCPLPPGHETPAQRSNRRTLEQALAGLHSRNKLPADTTGRRLHRSSQ
jgi:hypothetical protein